MSLSVSLQHEFPDKALDISFEARGGITALFGRSGAGKTTIVNAIAGLFQPHRGRIVCDGRVLLDTAQNISVPVARRDMGYVFQDGRLFPHMSVHRNLFYGAKRHDGAERIDADDVIDLLGLRSLLNRRPGALSGGEVQRVAMGRALLAGPRMLLLDEPLAGLDDPRREEVLPYLEHLRQRFDLPMLYVSHSVSEVARLADDLVILQHGKVAHAGDAATLFSDPVAAMSLGVRAAGTVLSGIVKVHHADGLTEIAISGGVLHLPGHVGQVGAGLRVRVAAHDVIVSRTRPDGLSALNILPVTITRLHRGAGPGIMVQMALGENHILARITQRSTDALELAPGMDCYAVLKAVSVARLDVGASPAP